MTLLLAGTYTALFLLLFANLVYLRRQHRRPHAGTAPRLSVLIPARNEEDNLRRLLPTLQEQDHPDFEVIVYDDGSEDDTWGVIASLAGGRIRGLRGEGPPPGWVGKVHALYQATRAATGDRYLFLDADAALTDAGALRRLADRFEALPAGSVLTGLTRLRGGGLPLVSLVPHVILTGLPWPLVRPVRLGTLGALNGQCWLIEAATYHRLEPHAHLPAEVLEDVQIGRYLKRHGLTPVLADVQGEVIVYMYRDLADAWRGFRKNAYLILGGTPLSFLILLLYFILTYLLAPFCSLWFLLALYVLKGLTDRRAGFPLWVSLLAPLSFLLAAVLQLDSAVSHWTGRIAWKGRRVS